MMEKFSNAFPAFSGKTRFGKSRDERKGIGVKKFLSRAGWLILFLAVLVVLYKGFDYLISDDTASQTRVSFHDYYKEDKLDYLFVGTSHINQQISAVQLSKNLNKNVFNLSSAWQDFIGSYYLIREAINNHKTDRIILELSVSRLAIKETDETAVFIITDYIKSPILRAQYLLSSFDMDGYVNAFLRLRRNIDPQDLPSAKELTKLYREKQEPEYTGYEGTDKYLGKGQWGVFRSWADEETGTAALNLKMGGLNNFGTDAIQDREVNYLRKIIELCKDNGIELTFLMPTYSELYLINFEHFEEVAQTFYDIAKEYNIPLIDFNKVKKEYLDFGVADFHNSDHLNSYTSDRISEFMTMYLQNPDGDYFYDTLEEKYPKTDDIIAVGYIPCFITEKGEYPKAADAEGDIETVRLDISALSWVKRPVKARIYVTEPLNKDEKEEGEKTVWLDKKEIKGEQLDAFTTQFVVPYNNLKTYYRVDLLDPETDEVLYEAFTRFDTK